MALSRRTLAAGLGAVLATPFVNRVTVAQAQHRWRIQGYLPANFDIQQDFAKWGEGLKQKSGGRIEIEALPVGAVVGVPDTLDAMRTGVLQGHFSGPPYFAGKDLAFAIIGDTSAAYDNVDQRDRWFTEGGGLDFMRRLYARHGAYCVSPVFTLAEWIPSKRALNGVEDLRGLKMRAPQGIISDLFRKFGSGVVVLPGTEVFNALETGVVDATDWAWLDLNEKTGLFRVCKFAIYAPHSMGVTDISLAQRSWDALSGDLKELVTREVAAFSAELKTSLNRAEAAAEQRVQASGVTLIRWPAAERAKIRAAQVEIWNEMAARSSLAREAVESHRTFMRRIGLEA